MNRCIKKQKKRKNRLNKGYNGIPDGIRTHDLPLRRRMLYPAELPKYIKDNTTTSTSCLGK